MQKIFFLVFVFAFSSCDVSPKNNNSSDQSAESSNRVQGLCGVSGNDKMIKVAGNLVTFKLIWINNSQKSVDDIQYSIDFYNIYDEYVTTKGYEWETDLITDPIKPGYQYTYVKAEYIKSSQAIKKYVITINRVHFTDDTYCKR